MPAPWPNAGRGGRSERVNERLGRSAEAQRFDQRPDGLLQPPDVRASPLAALDLLVGPGQVGVDDRLHRKPAGAFGWRVLAEQVVVPARVPLLQRLACQSDRRRPYRSRTPGRSTCGTTARSGAARAETPLVALGVLVLAMPPLRLLCKSV